LDAEVAGDLAQGMIEVREVIDGHVTDESAANFVVARAAVQPAKEEEQLQARRETDDDPVGIHKSLGRKELSSSNQDAICAGARTNSEEHAMIATQSQCGGSIPDRPEAKAASNQRI
jgi:hypothetical protein